MISETEDIIYQTSQPKMTLVYKNSTAVHSDKDCDKELCGLGTSMVDVHGGKKKMGLKKCISLKMEKIYISNKRNQLGGLLVCMLCATLCGSLRAIFFSFFVLFSPFSL